MIEFRRGRKCAGHPFHIILLYKDTAICAATKAKCALLIVF
jgi:hypothetical protein